jgi:hypothetical protein
MILAGRRNRLAVAVLAPPHLQKAATQNLPLSKEDVVRRKTRYHPHLLERWKRRQPIMWITDH